MRALLFSLVALGHAAQEYSAQQTTNPDCVSALAKSYKFFHAQHGGEPPADVNWRGTCFANDGDFLGLNLTGGWFDGGDYMKFTLPSAYSAACLSWGLLEFPDGYSTARHKQVALDEIKFVATYLLNSWNADKKQLVAVVGDVVTDHAGWLPCRLRTEPRPVSLVSSSCPGADLAAQASAALAAASLALKTEGSQADLTLAKSCETAARQLFSFADSNRGKYTDCVQEAKPFYDSEAFIDDLAWAAAWLYKLTNEASFLNQAKAFAGDVVVDSTKTISSADVSAGVALLMWAFTGETKYSNQLSTNFAAWKAGSQKPGQVGVNRYTANEAFLALVHAKLTSDTVSQALGLQLMNSLLGSSTQRSFVVGVGANSPQNPRHRSAHDSSAGDISTPSVNSHVLEGALVGGSIGTYSDSRTETAGNDVAVEYNALYTGALAAMIEILKPTVTACTINPCMNGGSCAEQNNAYVCTCPMGWMGTNCDMREDFCSPNPCQNNGHCVSGTNHYMCNCHAGFQGKTCTEKTCSCSINADCDTNTGLCTCRAGWEGATCELRTSRCDPNPCQNGGACANTDTGYKCSCLAGFGGDRCDVAVTTDRCSPNPCQNSGVCTNGATDFTCDCPKGYTGQLCDTAVNPCSPNPCQNSGVCVAGAAGEFTCTCGAGWLGLTCAQSDPCYPNPCNGGACTVAPAGSMSPVQCACLPGFGGDRCDQSTVNPATCSDKISVNPWKFNVITMGDVGTDAAPYQSDFQGPLACAQSVYVTGFSTNWVAVSSRTPPAVPCGLYAGQDVHYRSGDVMHGGIEAGGNVHLQSTTVHGGIVAGGDLFCNTGGNVKGPVTLGGQNKATQSLTIEGAVQVAQTPARSLNLPQLCNYFKSLSTKAGLLVPTVKYTNQWDYITVTGVAGLNVAEIPAAEMKQAHSIKVVAPANSVVIINVPGENVELDSLTWSWEGGTSAGRVIVNYPQAKVLRLSSGDHRTALLAPFADVTFPSGLVTGHLIANNLYGGGQVNDDFQFSGEPLIAHLADTCFTGAVNVCQPSPCANGGTCSPSLGGFKCTCPARFTGLRCDVDTDVTFTVTPGSDANPYWVRMDIDPAAKVDSAVLLQGSSSYQLAKQHWGSQSVFTLSPRLPLKEGQQVTVRVTDTFGKTADYPIKWLGGSSCGDKACTVDESNANCAADCPLADAVVDTTPSRIEVASYDSDQFAQAICDHIPAISPRQVKSSVVTSQSKLMTLAANTSSPVTVSWYLTGVNKNHAPLLAQTTSSMLVSNEALRNTLTVTTPLSVPTSPGTAPSGAAPSESGAVKPWLVAVLVVVGVLVLVAIAAGVVFQRRRSAATPVAAATKEAGPSADYELMDKQL